MFGMLLAGITLEKFIGIAVLISALVVAWSTLAHSVPLALMIGLGQLHGHIQHHSHGAGEEGSHLAVHKF